MEIPNTRASWCTFVCIYYTHMPPRCLINVSRLSVSIRCFDNNNNNNLSRRLDVTCRDETSSRYRFCALCNSKAKQTSNDCDQTVNILKHMLLYIISPYMSRPSNNDEFSNCTCWIYTTVMVCIYIQSVILRCVHWCTCWLVEIDSCTSPTSLIENFPWTL